MRLCLLFLLSISAWTSSAASVYIQYGPPVVVNSNSAAVSASGLSYSASADLGAGIFNAVSSMGSGLNCCFAYTGLAQLSFTNVSANTITLPSDSIRMHVVGGFGHAGGMSGSAIGRFSGVMSYAPPDVGVATEYAQLFADSIRTWDGDGNLIFDDNPVHQVNQGVHIDVIRLDATDVEFAFVLPEIVVEPGQTFWISHTLQTRNEVTGFGTNSQTGLFTGTLSMQLPAGVAATDLVSDAVVPLDWVSDSTADFDGDGVLDNADNCLHVANSTQLDTDADGIGNFCDPDISPVGINDCIVNAADLGELRIAFFSTPVAPNWNPHADFNGDGQISAADLGILKNAFFGPPGPSGIANLCP